MKKKISKLQIFRTIVQIGFLIFYPGLFILTFSQLSNIYSMMLKGKFNFIQAFPTITAAATFLTLTLVLGRFFCGWLCTFGAINDFIYLISKKVFKTKFRVNPKLDSILKYVKYVVLIFIVTTIWTTGSHLFSSASPWNAFAEITQFPQVLSDYTIGFAILVLIIFGAFFIERFFCRYLCPLGAVFTILSKLRIFKINKPNDKCGNCRLCTNNCAMGISLYKTNKVSSGECINCLKCIETCPRSNTQAEILGEEVNPALASSFAIIAMTGVYSISNLAATPVNNVTTASTGNNSSISASSNTNIANSSDDTNSSNNANSSENNTNSSNTSNSNNSSANVDNTSTNSSAADTTNSSSSSTKNQYKDGTYIGTGTGFRGGTTKIQITIKNGKITNLQTISSQDTPQFYQGAISTISDEILSSQSTSVDTVSGATFSSRGILEAVQNALSKAK
ncbi:MAG: 4Fe-4S binding protein [Bacillota bacterium]|nr:4Fe-4S binding protein [Bacillota bacterium]